jgi:hypothetical protein
MTDSFPSSPSQPSPELRSAMLALTSSWPMHVLPIIGLDPSIVVHQHRLRLTLGVMAFVPVPDSCPTLTPAPSTDAIWQVPAFSCASALAQNPLRMHSLG